MGTARKEPCLVWLLLYQVTTEATNRSMTGKTELYQHLGDFCRFNFDG